MHAPSTLPHIAALTAVAAGVGLFLGLAGWPHPDRMLEFPALLLAAILISAFAVRPGTPEDRGVMPVSFVTDFTTLLLLGPQAAMLVTAAGRIARGLAASDRTRQTLVSTATGLAAIFAAGAAYLALGGTLAGFVWPAQAVPIAAALLAYCFVATISAHVVVPLVARQPVDRSWFTRVLEACPPYVIGAALAAGLVELIDQRMWALLGVSAAPLFFAYRGYVDYVNRVRAERCREEVVASLDHGMAAVNGSGVVTLWSDALERISGCATDRALGRSLASAVPALAATDLPHAVEEVLASRNPRVLTRVGLPSAGGVRLLEVRILPVTCGATLLWQDVTDRARTEQALRRSEERLTLAAEGANDGLWEWDLRTQELYMSGRWRAMLGLPPQAATGRPEDWLGRVHAEDVAALKDALEAHLAGKTDFLNHEHRIRHEDGTYRWFLCRGVAVRGMGRRSGRIAGSLTDKTEGTIAQEQVRNAGFLDPLTGLTNRAVFVEGLGQRLAEFKQRRGGERFAVLYLDLDRFKVVNDSLGHLVGDELLVAVSRRLESCLRPSDVLARLGGDEFAVLLNGLSEEQQANAIAFRIQESLSSPFAIGGREVFTSASIGIAFGMAQYTNPDEIMRDADTAMYHAKSRGKARHELFDADMHARVRDRLGLENDLRHAVSSNDFEVHYQPIVLLSSGMCVGFESLIRWKRNGEPISPATFIPMAEELGLIEPLGTWVLQQVCRTFAEWQRRYPDGPLDYVTVNVSSRQLMQQNFLYIVEQAVHESGMKPCDLRLEITETALMDSPHVAAALLRDLREFGVKIYLDDFGTGYSSLSHLHKLPVDALKIDRSFVKSLQLADRPAIVESILALARTLNTSVVAEGIETDVQAIELERLGCTHAQGYLFSRPLPMQAAEELLVLNQPLGPKKTPPAEGAAAEPDLYYASVPFKWPEHVALRRSEPETAPSLVAATLDPDLVAAAAAADRAGR